MTEKLKGKFQLRHEMSEEDRQRFDLEMEKFADEQVRRKEVGFFPVGLESEEGKGYWESMCWEPKFEWNYSQNRHQIMESGISEEDELNRILHHLADFQDTPPNIPPTEICAIEKAYIASAKYLCRRIGKTIPKSVFKKEQSQSGQIKSPIRFFIEEQIMEGKQVWQDAWSELYKLAQNTLTKPGDMAIHHIGEFSVFLKKGHVDTSTGKDYGVEYEVDGSSKKKIVARQDFGNMFRRLLQEKSDQSVSPK